MKIKLVKEALLKEESENYTAISVMAKCSNCTVTYGNRDFTGDIPEGLGIGSGKEIELNIDIETGKIINWKSLTPDEVRAVIREEEYYRLHDPGFGPG